MSEWIFDQPHSVCIRKARLEHLASLGLDLSGKTILEVGAGIGLMTHFFEERWCQICSTDGRLENVEENIRRHPWRISRVGVKDLERLGDHDCFRPFEVVFCYGTLYHVSSPSQCIAELANLCTELFLLETAVSSVDNGEINLRPEKDGADQSLYGMGCRPARDWIMAELRKYFPYVYVTVTQPDHPWFPLDWPAEQEEARAVFVASRTELNLPTLTTELPMRQEVLR